MILGLTGRMGSGKDTIADLLVKKHKFTRVAFADTLKEVCSASFYTPVRFFNDRNLKDRNFDEALTIDETMINNLLLHLGIREVEITEEVRNNVKEFAVGKVIKSPRELMQFVGTEICRNLISDTIWVDMTMNKVESIDGNVVISDARMQNEREAIKKLGGLVGLVSRSVYSNDEVVSTHLSENDLPSEDSVDVVFNNEDSIVGLQMGVDLWYTTRRDSLYLTKN